MRTHTSGLISHSQRFKLIKNRFPCRCCSAWRPLEKKHLLGSIRCRLFIACTRVRRQKNRVMIFFSKSTLEMSLSECTVRLLTDGTCACVNCVCVRGCATLGHVSLHFSPVHQRDIQEGLQDVLMSGLEAPPTPPHHSRLN